MAYKKTTWIDDDGSKVVGTAVSASVMNNMEGGIAAREPRLDAFSHSSSGTGTLKWTHERSAVTNPVAALLVFVVQTGSTADNVGNVVIGSQTLRRIGSEIDSTETGRVYAYWASQLTGALASQSSFEVSVEGTGGSTKIAACYSFTGPFTLVPQVATKVSAATKTIGPARSSIRAGVECAIATGVFTGLDTPTVTPGASTTTDFTNDFGTTGAVFGRTSETTYATGSTTPGTSWTSTTEDDFAMVEVIVREQITSGPVSELPSNDPAFGDRCLFIADKTNGLVWDLVYEGEGELPWKCVGGSSLFDEITAVEETKSTSYTNLTTTGPSITLPLKGDYDIEVGFTGFGAVQAFMSYEIGATEAKDEDAAQGNPATGQNPSMRMRRKKSLSAVKLTSKFKSFSAATAAGFYNRWIKATPIRVG